MQPPDIPSWFFDCPLTRALNLNLVKLSLLLLFCWCISSHAARLNGGPLLPIKFPPYRPEEPASTFLADIALFLFSKLFPVLETREILKHFSIRPFRSPLSLFPPDWTFRPLMLQPYLRSFSPPPADVFNLVISSFQHLSHPRNQPSFIQKISVPFVFLKPTNPLSPSLPMLGERLWLKLITTSFPSSLLPPHS